MKMLLTAIALTIAAPAYAQTAAPADAHSGHANHEAMDHSSHAGHDMKDGCCAKDGEGKMACCAKMKAAGKTMDCCDKGAAKPAADAHAGHDMSKN